MKKILMPLLVIVGMGLGLAVYAAQDLERSDPATPVRQISPPNKYEKWLKEDVALIISEKERQVFARLTTDKERDTFIDSFWKHREGLSNILAGKPGWGSMKMRVFEGLREGSAEPVKVVTASYLSFTVSANIQAEADQAAQEAKIKQIFNLRGVSLLTEADLAWDAGKTDKAFHFFRLDDKSDKIYLVMVTPVSIAQQRFRIEVFEQNGGAKSNLLDTEFTLPQKNTAVFGFADRTGKPYFLSMQTIVWNAAEAPAENVVPAEGAVRIMGNLLPPKLIKEVLPLYPEIARQARVEGTVICEAQTDIYGRVQTIKILRSIPLLDQAAIDAVRQWVYEPMVIDGKPQGAIFTVTVRFTLDGGGRATVVGGVMGGVLGGGGGTALPKEELDRLQKMPPVKADGEIPSPRRIKYVKPIYPEAARSGRVEGVVILELVTDVHGRVESVKTLRSIPLLDQPAIDAVRQWFYAPFISDGKPRRCQFTASVRFVLE